MEISVTKVDVEYLKRAPDGGNHHVGSAFSRKQMIAAGHEIERLRRILTNGATTRGECMEFCRCAIEDADGRPCLDCDLPD